jgi:hypothetical protein
MQCCCITIVHYCAFEFDCHDGQCALNPESEMIFLFASCLIDPVPSIPHNDHGGQLSGMDTNLGAIVEMPFTETFARRSIASLKNPVSRWTDEQGEQLRAQICVNARSSDNHIATAPSGSRREQMGDESSRPATYQA